MADIREVSTGFVTADTAIVTVAETIGVTSDPINVGGESYVVVIFAWLVVTLAASVTSYTVRIRRGLLITDPLVGEANLVTATASTNIQANKLVVDPLSGDRAGLVYSASISCAAASANGSILEAGIVALIS